jgi:hypothetical protein
LDDREQSGGVNVAQPIDDLQRNRGRLRHDCVTGQECYDPAAFQQSDGIAVRSRKMTRVGAWFGLAALALQILLAPVFSGRALAMALDPLADAQICATGNGSGSMPMDHHAHCAECCLVHCAADAGPVMAPVAIDFPQPFAAPAMPAASYARPLVRGPPSRALPATGPPAALV